MDPVIFLGGYSDESRTYMHDHRLSRVGPRSDNMVGMRRARDDS